jgi:hypothetical protein
MIKTIALDIETVDADGIGSFRWWLPGFRILSLALSWRDGFDVKSWFSTNPNEIKKALLRLEMTKAQLVVHNLAFEKGVFDTHYPAYKLNWYADTMRLAQLHDNGGDWRDLVFNNDVLDPEASPDLGVSLEAAASRVLGKDLHHHKAERDQFLKETHGIRSKQGGFIHLLPTDILERYNIADTTVTLELYEQLAPLLSDIWPKDWELYLSRVNLMNKAYRRGISIDILKLQEYILRIDAEIDAIEAQFLNFHSENVLIWSKLYSSLPTSFNVGSNLQLKQLFVGVLGQTGGHITEKGEKLIKEGVITRAEGLSEYPSFQSKHLSDWGASGEILKQRRKRMLVLSQALSTLWMAEQGRGRIHPEVRIAGTRTNRVSGGRDE